MNKFIGIGRLTKDVELKHTPNNVAVATFTIAINRRFDKEAADFVNIVCWRKTAEFAANYFEKGRQVAVVGPLQSRQWKDKDGNNRISWEVIADELYFADGKKSEQKEQPGGFVIPADDFKAASEENDLPF